MIEKCSLSRSNKRKKNIVTKENYMGDQTVTVILSSVRGGLEQENEVYKRWGVNMVKDDEDTWHNTWYTIAPVEKKMTLRQLTNMIRDFSSCDGLDESGESGVVDGVIVEVQPRKNTSLYFGTEIVDDAIANELVWEIQIYDDYRE